MRVFFTCFAVVLLGAATARASSTYPSLVQSDVGMSSTPGCDLCHFNGQTGMGTVTTPVGKSLKARGCMAGSPTSLSNALAKLTTDKTDSDGDGMSDIDELKAGRNPNVVDGSTDGGSVTPPTTLPPPTYGCTAVPGILPLAGLALAALALRRRR
jgi:uncharacterized protein (TIGR03382 family)